MNDIITLVLIASIGISISAILYAEQILRKPQERHTYIHHVHENNVGGITRCKK